MNKHIQIRHLLYKIAKSALADLPAHLDEILPNYKDYV